MPRTGGNSQDRRRARRAADRRLERSTAISRSATETLEVEFDDLVAAAGETLTAAGSGSTSLPLSDQDRAWDASAADGRVREWAGASDAPNAKYGRAFFVKDGDGSNFGDYRLGYADVVDGTLTAIWRGVVAVAGVLQGARGGVKGLSDSETASVKSKVEAYYAKARDEYDDDSIKVPWAADESKGESAASLLAYAEIGPGVGETDSEIGADEAEYAGRIAFWEHELAGTPEVFALERILEFAPGDVAWGPEDGFLDLLCDVNDLLYEVVPDGYRYRAVDAGVKLDKVLICDYEDETLWSAPITIDAQGEPVLSDQAEWRPVEPGLIETAMPEDAGEASSRQREVLDGARLRFELRDIVLAADGALAPPLPDEHQPGETVPRRRPTPGAPKPAAKTTGDAATSGEVAWQAIFVPEATLTDDGRAFAPGSLSWRELPLSLMAMTETSAQGGHDGAVLAGRIDNIWREGNLIMASGVFDSGEFGAEIARMVGDQTLRGLSVDTAIHEYEIASRGDFFTEDGTWKNEAPTRAESDDPSVDDILFGKQVEDPIFVVTKAVIGMATVCPFPAFAGASISLVASGGGAIWRYNRQAAFELTRREVVAEAEAITEAASRATVTFIPKEIVVEVAETGERMTLSLENPDELDESGRQVAYEALLEQGLSEEQARGTVWPEGEALTASAAGHAPVEPPAEWFEDPALEELTPLTIDDEGRIFGHAWAWDTCHIAFPDSCVLAPHTRTENAYFHLGEIECSDGSRLSVGKITLDAPHAGARLSREQATSHYDQTGTVVAHVVCGEDEFGGWVSGAIVPDLPESKLRLLRGSALSGDWRNVNGNLELVALLAVNVPGFPVPRPRALVAMGAQGEEETLALTAAGIFTEKTPCDTIAEIAGLAAEVAPPVESEFAALLEQVEE